MIREGRISTSFLSHLIFNPYIFYVDENRISYPISQTVKYTCQSNVDCVSIFTFSKKKFLDAILISK